jgi:hypothetical protein
VVELDVVLLIVLGMLVVAFFVGRRLVRWSRRQVLAATAQANDLRTRMQPPGPRREAAVPRARLDAELHATREMLRTAPQGLVFRADAASLVEDLDSTGTSLSRELAAIAAFRDAGQQRAALDAVRPQVEQLVDTTYRARQTLLQTAAEDRAGELQRIRARVDQQAAALDIYRRDGGQLSL